MSILVCGPLCNNDIAISEILGRFNLSCKIIRHPNYGIPNLKDIGNEFLYVNQDQIKLWEGSYSFYKECLKSDLVITFNGHYRWLVNEKTWWLHYIFGVPKIINISCGSDMTELVVAKDRMGHKYRNFVKKIHFNIINPYPHAIQNIENLQIKNFRFTKFPCYLLGKRKEFLIQEGPIHYFMPSNLDWGKNDAKVGRNSTKGNDRFIKAFIKAVKAGANIRCSLLERGPDVEPAKSLIQESGVDWAFKMQKDLTRTQFWEQIQKADVIVDQFDVGGFGGIAIESMAQAKPVMIHLDEQYYHPIYGEEPPIINCHSEDEIFQTLMQHQDRTQLQEMGIEAEKWVRKHHDPHQSDFSEFMQFVRMAVNV